MVDKFSGISTNEILIITKLINQRTPFSKKCIAALAGFFIHLNLKFKA
jgi:hypothetical protein